MLNDSETSPPEFVTLMPLPIGSLVPLILKDEERFVLVVQSIPSLAKRSSNSGVAVYCGTRESLVLKPQNMASVELINTFLPASSMSLIIWTEGTKRHP